MDDEQQETTICCSRAIELFVYLWLVAHLLAIAHRRRLIVLLSLSGSFLNCSFSLKFLLSPVCFDWHRKDVIIGVSLLIFWLFSNC